MILSLGILTRDRKVGEKILENNIAVEIKEP